MKSKKTVYEKGCAYIRRLVKETKYPYSLTECRIAAMAYEAGWKACNMKRALERK
jgi:hypothetical protein